MSETSFSAPFVVVLVLTALFLGAAFGSDTVRPDPAPNYGASSLSMGVGCLPEATEATEDGDERGWLHVVADGRAYDVTMQADVAHDPSRRVDVAVENRTGGEWIVAIEAAPRTRTGKPARADENCRTGTSVTLATMVPTDHERVVVRANGRTVATMEREETTPRVRGLPSPIEL